VQREGLDDQAARAILSRILTCELLPGEHIVENSIAQSLGVSRSTVRAALRTLLGCGIVEKRPHQGCFIRKYSLPQVCEILETREAIEGLAARVMAERGSDEAIRRLSELAAVVEHDSETADWIAFRTDNYVFHQHMVSSCGNPYLGECTNFQALLLIGYLAAPALRHPPAGALAVTHEAIARAIAARDPDGAEAAARGHVRAARAWVARAARAGVEETVHVSGVFPTPVGRLGVTGEHAHLRLVADGRSRGDAMET
jgi:DNA-binding GntR family transcriptional regulator